MWVVCLSSGYWPALQGLVHSLSADAPSLCRKKEGGDIFFHHGSSVGPGRWPAAGGILDECEGWRWSLWVVAIVVSLESLSNCPCLIVTNFFLLGRVEVDETEIATLQPSSDRKQPFHELPASFTRD